MGYWSESIYGNDRAMDILADIEYLFRARKKQPVDIIRKEVKKNCDDDALLVLADFELFISGKITHTSNVVESIDKLIENTDTWDNPQKRKDELLKFKNKILTPQSFTKTKRSRKEILNWLSEKRKLDIFNIF